MRRRLGLVLAACLAIPSAIVTSVPAVAECSHNVNRWPPFEEVAPTARRVIVGKVTGTTGYGDPTGWLSIFTVHVERVLRGSAPRYIEIHALRSGLPLRGERTCRRNSMLHAKVGDRLAIAFDGKVRGVKGRVTSAAWIRGEPHTIATPGLEQTDLDTVLGIMGLPPRPATRGVEDATTPATAPTGGILQELFDQIRARVASIEALITHQLADARRGRAGRADGGAAGGAECSTGPDDGTSRPRPTA